MNPDELSDEELEAILAKRKEEKFKRYSELADYMLECERWMEDEAAAYAEEIRRNKVYLVSSPGVVDTYDGEKIKLKISEYLQEYVEIMRTTPSRLHSYNDHTDSIDVEQWPALEERLKAVGIKIDESVYENIKSFKRAANYKVSRDAKSFYIVTNAKTKSYVIREIPGCTLDEKVTNRWKFPLPEGWRIFKALEEEQKNGHTVEWEDDSHDFAMKQYETRLSLDVIAKKEKPEQDIVLNGIKLHDYQAVEVEFIEAAGGSGILGPEMGLGKTPISLAIAERMCERGEGNTILIVCPAALIPNWQRQLIKFTNMCAYRFSGETPSKFDTAMALTKKYRYYIINYDILSTEIIIPEEVKKKENGDTVKIPAYKRKLWVEVILKYLRADMVIFDEAHYMQNVTSKRSDAGQALVSIPRRVLLSGTIFTSYAPQLWANVYIAAPEIAGPYESFLKFYTVDGKAAKNIEQLRDILRPILIRHTKKQVIKELPPINRIVREFELSKKARAVYDKAYNEGLLVAIDELTGDVTDTKAIPGILAQLMKLKQICAEDKYDYIANLATELFDQSENGHRKVIVFTQFVDNPPVIKNIRARLGYEAVSFSGQDEVEDRMKIVDRFQNSADIQYLVCSIKAASEGLDITAAGHVVFSDLMWTPASHHQAEARAYGRLSDLHSIDSYYVIADNTIENDIMALLEAKLNTFNMIVEGSEDTRMDTSIAMELIRAIRGRKK
jgi:SNF2 family DNA or RNA helicase